MSLKREHLKTVRLQDMSELECSALRKLALEYLQNIGATFSVPRDLNALSKKHSLRKKYAFYLSTKDKNKDQDRVFGIPLEKVVENDQLLRLQKSASFAANSDLFATDNHDSVFPQSGSEIADRSPAAEDAQESSMTSKPTCECTNALNCTLIHTPPTSKRNVPSESRPLKRRGAIIADSVNEIDPYQSQLLEALSLTETTHNHRKDDRSSLLPPTMAQVPYVVQKCCDHITEYGIHVTGIFRVAGSKKRVKQLRDEFDHGADVDINADYNPHDVAALLKEFLRDLPEALLTKDLYPAFISSSTLIMEERIPTLQALLWLLPLPNRDTLYTLVKFLWKIAKHSETTCDKYGEHVEGNKMNIENLATIFGPNLLHRFKKTSSESQISKQDLPEDYGNVIKTVTTIIKHHEELFQVCILRLLQNILSLNSCFSYLQLNENTQHKVLNFLKTSYPEAVEYLLRRKTANYMRTLTTNTEAADVGKQNTTTKNGSDSNVACSRLSYQHAMKHITPTPRKPTHLNTDRQQPMFPTLHEKPSPKNRINEGTSKKWLSNTERAVGEFRTLSSRLADHVATVELDRTASLTSHESMDDVSTSYKMENTPTIFEDKSRKDVIRRNPDQETNKSMSPEVRRRGGVCINAPYSKPTGRSPDDKRFSQNSSSESEVDLFGSVDSLDKTIIELQSGFHFSGPNILSTTAGNHPPGLSPRFLRKYNVTKSTLPHNNYHKVQTRPTSLPQTENQDSAFNSLDKKTYSCWLDDSSNERNATGKMIASWQDMPTTVL
ncbi:rho GTPase-activating protein 6 isoform X2 [Ciona intestinalis]